MEKSNALPIWKKKSNDQVKIEEKNIIIPHFYLIDQVKSIIEIFATLFPIHNTIIVNENVKYFNRKWFISSLQRRETDTEQQQNIR